MPELVPELVPGRECGGCNVCCVALTIDEPTLRKPQGFRCRNAMRDNGCAIYHARPDTCRTFYCGWRWLKWVRQGLRPDLSGVLVRLHNEMSRDGSGRTGVVFTLLNGAALRAEGLAESVAAAVLAQVPVYVQVPGPPGYTSGMARMNDALLHPVVTKDKKAVLAVLQQARAQGKGPGQHRRIVLKPEGVEGDSGVHG